MQAYADQRNWELTKAAGPVGEASQEGVPALVEGPLPGEPHGDTARRGQGQEPLLAAHGNDDSSTYNGVLRRFV